MRDVENVGRCPRCKMAIIAEQLASHECNIAIKGAETIFLDWIADGFTDENDDHVRMAESLNGILYALIVCKHNPPHRQSNPPPAKLPVYSQGESSDQYVESLAKHTRVNTSDQSRGRRVCVQGCIDCSGGRKLVECQLK